MEAYQMNASTVYGLKGHQDIYVAVSPEHVERLKEIVHEYGDLSRAPARLTIRGTFVTKVGDGYLPAESTQGNDVTVCELEPL